MGYFSDSRFSPDLANLLFKFRTRMFNVRNNFRNNYREENFLCPVCREVQDTQQHLFDCEPIQLEIDDHDSKYEDIFSNNIEILLKVSLVLKKIVMIREKLLEATTEQEPEA